MRTYNMECPTCKLQLHLNMKNSFIGKNIQNISLFVYYQICPECGEPIIGIKESAIGELYMNPNNIEGLVFLKKERK
ncbi:MAG: hypothetical protein ABJB73_09455 [Candidatus Nitrosocosmicus sp.]